MNLKPEHKQYILEHENEIRENNWEEFFKPGEYPFSIGEPLYLANIPFMEYLKYVPEYAFYNCENLTSVTIPSGVTYIGNYAFGSCTGLTSITIPEGVTSIGERAFSYCTGLTSITIPESVTVIDFAAFHHCSGLTSVTLAEGVTSIGSLAFFSCKNLTSVVIPNSVTSIGKDAFACIPTDLIITYGGTKEQWKQIYDKETFRYVYFTVNCIDGKIVKKRPKK